MSGPSSGSRSPEPKADAPALLPDSQQEEEAAAAAAAAAARDQNAHDNEAATAAEPDGEAGANGNGEDAEPKTAASRATILAELSGLPIGDEEAASEAAKELAIKVKDCCATAETLT